MRQRLAGRPRRGRAGLGIFWRECHISVIVRRYTAGLFFAEDFVADVVACAGQFLVGQTSHRRSGIKRRVHRALFDWAWTIASWPGETYSMFQPADIRYRSIHVVKERFNRRASALEHVNTVSSADDSAKRAEGAGRDDHRAAVGVMDVAHGRPARSVRSVLPDLRPRKHVGAMVVNEPGRSAGRSCRRATESRERSTRSSAGRRKTARPRADDTRSFDRWAPSVG